MAGLLGGRDPATVQRIALSKFRAVSLELVTEGDMMGNKPDPSLHVKTTAATFNSVDAFVSHSWSDDPRTKWTQLQRWRAQFKREHKREPVVWIDKFCIDQTNIDASLLCLPVFLASCQRLLVLAGTSYTTRM